MMSQCIVPNWNLSHQRQAQGEATAGDDDDQHRNTNSNRSSSPHVHSDHNLTYVVPMENYEVAELTWENGQLALHGLGGIQTKQQTASSWEKPGDHTLESIVHQATFPSFHQNQIKNSINPKWEENSIPQMHIDPNQNANLSPARKWRLNSGQETSMGSMAVSSAGKLRGNLGEDLGFGANKRVRSESERVVMRSSFTVAEDRAAAAVSASASATFGRDTDMTMMTWNSFESPRSLKSGGRNGAGTGDDDSACQISNSENMEGDQRMNKGESFRRRSRAAAIHNQSERRRRDRINEKMRALQKLVPNASKTDKASMLDEVIEYLKQLQAQVQMMSTARNMPMPQVVMQQQQQQIQQQMSLLAARMGMGLGMGMGVPGPPMGMLDINTLTRNVPHSLPPLIPSGIPASSFVSPHFPMPPVVPNQLKPNVGDPQTSFNDAYASFFAQQSMNMDFFNKMAAMYRQQPSHQTSKKPVTLSHPNNGQA